MFSNAEVASLVSEKYSNLSPYYKMLDELTKHIEHLWGGGGGRGVNCVTIYYSQYRYRGWRSCILLLQSQRYNL
jgi:hypothetical protein